MVSRKHYYCYYLNLIENPRQIMAREGGSITAIVRFLEEKRLPLRTTSHTFPFCARRSRQWVAETWWNGAMWDKGCQVKDDRSSEVCLADVIRYIYRSHQSLSTKTEHEKPVCSVWGYKRLCFASAATSHRQSVVLRRWRKIMSHVSTRSYWVLLCERTRQIWVDEFIS